MNKKAWVSAARWGLAALGVIATGALIADAGFDRVAAVVIDTGAWLPLVIALEVAFIAADTAALRALYDPSAAPARAWARSALIAYVVTAFLPGGRVAGEAARATSLSLHVGGARATATAVVFHGAFLWGNVLVSLACYAAVVAASSLASPLASLLAWNIGFNAVLGAALLVGPRLRLPGWLGRVIAKRSRLPGELDRALRSVPRVPTRSIAWSFCARAIQVVQCGVVLAAVAGGFDAGRALIAEGIQLVALNLGDAVPGQAGVLETAYRVFGPRFSLAGSAPEALGIALLLRASRLAVAGASGALWAMSRPRAGVKADA